MRAAAFVGRRQIEIQEVPTPQPQQPGEVLVRVVRSGICGSDKGLYLNEGAKPGIHGHEVAGLVVACGPEARRFDPGARVLVYDVIGCGVCRFCAQGQFTYCQVRRGNVCGGYGEFLVAPERNLIPLPDDFGWEKGCLMSDCFGTPAKAARKLGIASGDTVVIFGCGPIGLNAVQAAKAMGAAVISVDLLDYRLQAASRLGADQVLDARADKLVEHLHSLTGGGADKAMDCSGNPEAEKKAIDCVRPGGRVAFVGENPRLEISPSGDLIRRDIEIMGSWYMHIPDFQLNCQLVRTTQADPQKILTHQVSLDQIEHGFQVFCDRQDGCLKAVVNMAEP